MVKRLHACNSSESKFMRGFVPACVHRELQIPAIRLQAVPSTPLSLFIKQFVHCPWLYIAKPAV